MISKGTFGLAQEHRWQSSHASALQGPPHVAEPPHQQSRRPSGRPFHGPGNHHLPAEVRRVRLLRHSFPQPFCPRIWSLKNTRQAPSLCPSLPQHLDRSICSAVRAQLPASTLAQAPTHWSTSEVFLMQAASLMTPSAASVQARPASSFQAGFSFASHSFPVGEQDYFFLCKKSDCFVLFLLNLGLIPQVKGSL